MNEEVEEEQDVLAVSIGNYLAALQVNEKRAENVIQATQVIVQQTENCKLPWFRFLS